MIDKNQLAMGSEPYKTQSGLKIFSQNKKDYPCFLKDLEEYNQSLEQVPERLDLGIKESDGGETMEEDEIEDNPLFKRKRKDKTLKCSKCGRGGHPEATCLSKPDNT